MKMRPLALLLVALAGLLGVMTGSAAAKTTVTKTTGLIQVNRSITLRITDLGGGQALYAGEVTHQSPQVTTNARLEVTQTKRRKRRRRGKESSAESAAKSKKRKKKTTTSTVDPSQADVDEALQTATTRCADHSRANPVTVRHNSNPPFVIGQSYPQGNVFIPGFYDYSVTGVAAPTGEQVEALQVGAVSTFEGSRGFAAEGFEWSIVCSPMPPANLSVTMNMPF